MEFCQLDNLHATLNVCLSSPIKSVFLLFLDIFEGRVFEITATSTMVARSNSTSNRSRDNQSNISQAQRQNTSRNIHFRKGVQSHRPDTGSFESVNSQLLGEKIPINGSIKNIKKICLVRIDDSGYCPRLLCGTAE